MATCLHYLLTHWNLNSYCDVNQCTARSCMLWSLIFHQQNLNLKFTKVARVLFLQCLGFCKHYFQRHIFERKNKFAFHFKSFCNLFHRVRFRMKIRQQWFGWWLGNMDVKSVELSIPLSYFEWRSIVSYCYFSGRAFGFYMPVDHWHTKRTATVWFIEWPPCSPIYLLDESDDCCNIRHPEKLIINHGLAKFAFVQFWGQLEKIYYTWHVFFRANWYVL